MHSVVEEIMAENLWRDSEFTNKFKNLMRGTVKFEKKVDTQANLRGKVLKELCNTFCFNYENFKGCINDIDRLVNIRNSIAHGENASKPDINNIIKYIEAVKDAMDVLLEEIDNFLTCEAYLVAPNTP
jgi:hypothetical protein